MGNQIADDYKQRIDKQTHTYNDGGWDGSLTAGVKASRLAMDLLNTATAAVGAGKVVAVTVKAGANGALARAATSANATVNFMENMALRNVQIGAIHGFKSAHEVNAIMRGFPDWSPAWKPGTQVAETTLKTGTRVQMVVSAEDYTKLMTPGADISRSFGGWAAFDNVPSLSTQSACSDARDEAGC